MTARSLAILGGWLLAAGSAVAGQQPVNPVLPPPPPGPAALTVPQPFAAIRPGVGDLYKAPGQFQQLTPQPPHQPYQSLFFATPLYLVPQPPTPTPQSAQVRSVGRLRLEMSPGDAQVAVDGTYVGIVDDFGPRGRALDLAAGRHIIEVSAAGYGTETFAVNIVPDEILRYRGDLRLLTVPAPLRAMATEPKMLYVIPRCYAGDKPPEAPLPKGCDVKQMRVRPAQ